MTLILSARCRDGCVALADRRCIKYENRVRLPFEDDWKKLQVVRGMLVFNHGYNLIGGSRWYERKLDLTPDETNEIYEGIASDMLNTSDEKAWYAFITPKKSLEVTIERGKRAVLEDLSKKPFLLSGDGKKYVDSKRLRGVEDLKRKDALMLFKEVFEDAFRKQEEAGDWQFSKEYTIFPPAVR